MQKNNLIQPILISVILICVLISGYILVTSNKQTASQGASALAPMVNGKQLIQMTVNAVKYNPNSFTVKAGIPVSWQITSSGEPGCDSGEVIARGLTDPIFLNPNQGQVTIKEFTAQTPGTYQFGCPMGMVLGTIEVVN